MPPLGYEPADPASERPQIHASVARPPGVAKEISCLQYFLKVQCCEQNGLPMATILWDCVQRWAFVLVTLNLRGLIYVEGSQ